MLVFLITGASTNTPTATLELLPLDIYITLEACKSAYRLTIVGHCRDGQKGGKYKLPKVDRQV